MIERGNGYLRDFAISRNIAEKVTAAAVVLDVSGVGFELGVSGATTAMLPQIGKEQAIYQNASARGCDDALWFCH